MRIEWYEGLLQLSGNIISRFIFSYSVTWTGVRNSAKFHDIVSCFNSCVTSFLTSIYCLFNDAVNNAEKVARNNRMFSE